MKVYDEAEAKTRVEYELVAEVRGDYGGSVTLAISTDEDDLLDDIDMVEAARAASDIVGIAEDADTDSIWVMVLENVWFGGRRCGHWTLESSEVSKECIVTPHEMSYVATRSVNALNNIREKME